MTEKVEVKGNSLNQSQLKHFAVSVETYEYAIALADFLPEPWKELICAREGALKLQLYWFHDEPAFTSWPCKHSFKIMGLPLCPYTWP